MTKSASSTALYRTVWRWHFYAGLFVLPFIMILSVTGSIYLFKPQIDRWEERAFRGLPAGDAVSPDEQLAVAMSAYPGARFDHYRLPEHAGDAAMIQFTLADGSAREVYVSPQGRLLGTLDPDARISELVASVHGSLLLGEWGDRLVELAASWTIVLILTGLYLWWPRPFRMAGTLWPRLGLRGRPLLKDIHRVTGFWIAGLVLVMLASGLPWAGTWGSAFKWVRTELGLVQGKQDWKIGPKPAPAEHDHSAMAKPGPMSGHAHMASHANHGVPLSAIVANAQAEHMVFPVRILPPHATPRFGAPTGNVWTAASQPQNRPLTRQVTYDPTTGAETSRSGFGDKHLVDRIVNTGIAWHEGQLFGLANQLIGVATAIALMSISILGVVMWLNRRPQGEFGAPPAPDKARLRWAIAAIVVMALLLPLFGASLVVLIVLDRIAALIRRRPI
ncbi:PepSY domain-containing protein [Sphingomonas sp. AOB5]|uniref:PepSY-associated TM helix domain-containing protein n=1 Tax=Sphingomonas sp. AOB5 TaxID=3034017 RepID=UPI0023F953DE|nr:PepSY domain-containing protein [Sphingomonas sp. AOB5]MDF7774083.1 PepSY domain-containing protein [Sphingomonas sp. AOB5]